MILQEAALKAFKEHVVNCYPHEACGVIIMGSYFPCRNVADDPVEHFRISSIEMAGLQAVYGRVEAILHSHPYRIDARNKWPAEWPSTNDMAQWIKGDVPWGIASTEGENVSDMLWLDDGDIAPLVGRPFVHGVWDCYSLVRDWFRVEQGITLQNFARGMDWWDRGYNLYEENFAKANFIEVKRDDLQVGDCAIMQIMSKVPNHAAVVTGSNTLLQHFIHRKSGEYPLNKWERMVVRWVRYAPSK